MKRGADFGRRFLVWGRVPELVPSIPRLAAGTRLEERSAMRSFPFRRLRLAASLSFLAAAFSLSAPAAAIVARHDVDDARLLAAAERFAASVGQVLPDGNCTLIAPDACLTAAHVAHRAGTGTGRVRLGTETRAVRATTIHPEGEDDGRHPPEVDLAILWIDAPFDAAQPLPLCTGEDENGQRIWIAGTGDRGDGRGAPRLGDGRLRAAENRIIDAGPRRLFFRFDEPPAGEPLEGVSGPGDSGGPALLERDGALCLAGVSSGAQGEPGRYGVSEVYVRVSRYVDWIRAALAAPPAQRSSGAE